MKRKYYFNPFNMTPPDTDVFNMFLRMKRDIYGKPSDNPDKMLKPNFDVVRELCGGEDDYAKYMHYFIAIKGKQVNGKNIFLDAIGYMTDKQHYITTSDPDDLFGTHAEGFYRKLLVNLNESEGKKHFNLKAILNHSLQNQL